MQTIFKLLSFFTIFLLLLAACGGGSSPPSLAADGEPTLVFVYTDN